MRPRLPLLVQALAVALAIVGFAGTAVAHCGNGVVDAGEDCDDGGTCLGGSNAGVHCTAESDCSGSGRCVAGTRAGTACTNDTGCPGGACRRCVPEGGDGCAANCTTESDVLFEFIPGQVDQRFALRPHTSGVTVTSDFLSIPDPFLGVCAGGDSAGDNCVMDADCRGEGKCAQVPRETLTIGKARGGRIPVVIKADSVHIPGIHGGPGSGCGCFRGIPLKTCGGVLFEVDGVTPASNCTPILTAGTAICTGKAPCAFIHGEANSAAGEIGCDGLDNIDVTFAQNSGGTSGVAGPPVVTFSGAGGPGSASLLSSLGISVVLGRCYGSDPATYGPDGVYCTADDPSDAIVTVVGTSPAVTGTATTVIHDANRRDGYDLGPVSVTGTPFSCAALERGSAAGAGLVQAFDLVHLDTIDDVVVSGQYFAQGTVPPLPTPTPTPVPLCTGDCDGSGEVTVGELIIMVNVALGNAPSSACRHGVPDGTVIDVAIIIQAVHHGLSGCAG